MDNNETLRSTRRGISGQALRAWGMLFLVLGVAGQSILCNGVLRLGSVSGVQLLEAMQSSDTAMGAATVAILLNAVSCCAVPIFAFLLVEGFRNTADYRKYLLRVLGLAALCELPYNLAAGGGWLVTDSRNPVFALALALIMLYFFRRYGEKAWKDRLIKALVLLCAILWVEMLNIDEGEAIVILAAILWAARGKPTMRTLFGCCGAACCCLISVYYLAAPLAFIAIHYYNGEKGEGNRIVNYLAYPVILLAFGLFTKLYFGI